MAPRTKKKEKHPSNLTNITDLAGCELPSDISQKLAQSFRTFGEPTFRAIANPSNPSMPLFVLGWDQMPDLSLELSCSLDGRPHMNMKGDPAIMELMADKIRGIVPGFMSDEEWKEAFAEEIPPHKYDGTIFSTEFTKKVKQGLKKESTKIDKSSYDQGKSPNDRHNVMKAQSCDGATLTATDLNSPPFSNLPHGIRTVLTGRFPVLGDTSVTTDLNELFPGRPDLIVRWSKVPTAFVRISLGNDQGGTLSLVGEDDLSVETVANEVRKVAPTHFPKGAPATRIPDDHPLLPKKVSAVREIEEKSIGKAKDSLVIATREAGQTTSTKTKKAKKGKTKGKVDAENAEMLKLSKHITASQLSEMVLLFPDYGPDLRKIIESNLPELGIPVMRIKTDQTNPGKPRLFIVWHQFPDVVVEVFYGDNGAALTMNAHPQITERILHEFHKVVPKFLLVEESIIAASEQELWMNQGKVVASDIKHSYHGPPTFMEHMKQCRMPPCGEIPKRISRKTKRAERAKAAEKAVIYQDEIDQELEALAVTDQYWTYIRSD